MSYFQVTCSVSKKVGMLALLAFLVFSISGLVNAQTTSEQIQEIYVSYYGRPADPAGLAYWEQQLRSNGGNLSGIIDQFGNSAEYTNRFAALNNQQLINNIYLNLFGRDADTAGAAFYLNHLQNGTMTLGTIALNIADGVQTGTNDAQIINNKIAVAAAYTAAVSANNAAYGDAQIVSAVNLISGVDSSQASVNVAMNTITTLTTAGGTTDTEIIGDTGHTGNCATDTTNGASLDITALPASASSAYQAALCKYTKITAPNGRPIHIYAQNQITNEQVVRARNILEFFLSNVPGSEYGSDKSALTNRMADNGATLLLLNGSDTGNLSLEGQPLYQTENVVEGSTAYINNDYENHRDAAFEEILHLVHDTGIGVDGANTQPGVLTTSYQAEIRAALNNAKPTWDGGKGLWGENESAWYNELKAENSLTQEYLAAVIDSYYGYWGAWTDGTGGMWGIYTAKTRNEIQSKDPEGWKLVDPANPKFFNPWLTYTARIDPAFNGTFSLAFDSNQPYTHKSQYLLNAQLLGNLFSNLIGNDQDNQLTGNEGNNTLTGGKGNDKLNGGAGSDTAKFSGNNAEYTISTDAAGVTTITDTVSNRDGTDTLQQVEMVMFNDQTIGL